MFTDISLHYFLGLSAAIFICKVYIFLMILFKEFIANMDKL